MEENVPAVDLMLACSTQWRSGGFGLMGLDYTAVRNTAEIMGINMDAAMLRKIGLMERLTLKRLAEESEQTDRKRIKDNGFKRRHPH